MDRFGMAASAAVMCLAGAAMGGTIEASYNGMAGGFGATWVRVGWTTQQAGHMVHEYTSGARAGERFRTFCIDMSEGAETGTRTYDIVDLADAPQPGAPYGQAKADAVSAVIANAIAVGWIDSNLQADTSQVGYLGKMGAIQAAIWKALGHNIRINSILTSDSLEYYYAYLMDDARFDESLRARGLRAMVSADQQDMLYVVPLPPAAFAGAGMLAIGFGVRTLRRR